MSELEAEIIRRAKTLNQEQTLRELLRLYEWRFVLARKEIQVQNTSFNSAERAEVKRDLVRYGLEKKASWNRARELLMCVSCQANISICCTLPDPEYTLVT